MGTNGHTADLVDRVRDLAAVHHGRLGGYDIRETLNDAAAEIVRLRLRLSDLETSIAAFRQTVNEWEF